MDEMLGSSRLLLATVVIIAVGIIALPSTVSLFAGQHYWYNVNQSGNDIPCEKCHADVFEELNQSKFHVNWGGNNYADRNDCAACHRGNTSITYAADDGTAGGGWVSGKQAHAASVVACMLCHEWSPDETNNYGPPAGGFNVSDFGVTSPYNYGTKNGTYEAHNAFIARAIQDGTLQDANEACIACHTHVAVKITWNHSRALEFNIGFGNPITTANGPHN
ncbi:hypothetical protein, partial [Geoglobus ahangari]